MKKVYLILSLVLTFSSVFANDDFAELLYYKGRSLGNTPKAQIDKANEILGKVELIAAQKGISVKRVALSDRQGNRYSALRVEPNHHSDLNREALRVSREFEGLPLIFSPYDLSRSRANAFFDSDGSKIGVPYDFILGDVSNSSYLHELFHATTYRDIIKGKNNIWGGVLKATPGKYISSKNTSFYWGFVSLDELPATALSLKLDVQSITELKRIQTSAEFQRSRGVADNLLGEIYQSVLAGSAVAAQLKDVSARALTQIANHKKENTLLKLGKNSRQVITSVFSLDAFTREFQAGRGVQVAHAKETEWKLYWGGNYTQDQLRKRLEKIGQTASLAEAKFKETLECIYILIEYPRIERTDFRCLENKGPNPFLTFQYY